MKNTTLKAPLVAKNIPTVAERTQGEVVTFAAAAAKKMGDDGLVVLLEGREATVNYIPSRYRYTLTMSDNVALGQRRAAQRIGAAAQAKVAERSKVSDSELAAIICEELVRLCKEEERAQMAQSGPVIYEVNLLIDNDIYEPYIYCHLYVYNYNQDILISMVPPKNKTPLTFHIYYLWMQMLIVID